MRHTGDPSQRPPDATIVRAGPDDFEHRRVIAQARVQLFGDGPLPRIGRYRIEARLGAGGMGEVYLAHDEELDRKVAIKRMLAALSSERDQVRLRREARALAKLSHPNVVQIYEIGEHEQRTYLAMEYVEGETLGRWLDTPRPWPQVLARFLAAGRGLAAAHLAGVVHRDFKPDNVLLGRDAIVRVADFGLALAGERASVLVDAPGELDLRASMTGSVAGTIRYMAIEQLLGEAVDARSDQFSFCVALYEALWGQPPFPLDSLDNRLRALEHDQPRVPPRSKVPRGLWTIVRRGLSRSPAQRWPDMPRLLAALEAAPRRRRWARVVGLTVPLVAAALLGGELIEQQRRTATIAACEAEGEAIAADWNPEIRGAIERAFVASSASLGPSTWQLASARMDRFAARWAELRSATCRETELEHQRSPASREQVDECLDEARTSFATLASAWQNADAAMVRHATMAAHNLPPLESCLDEAWLAARVRPSVAIESEVQALRTRIQRARGLKLAVQFERGEAEASATVREAEALGWPPLVAEARLVHGELEERVGRLDDARASYHRAFLDATACGHDFVAMRASIGMSLVAGRLGHAGEALEWGDLALALLGRLDLLGSMHEASARHAIGRAQRIEGRTIESRRTFERVLALDEAAHGPDHPDNAISLNTIGRQWLQLGDFEAAEAAHRRALAIQRRTLGYDHPDVLHSLFSLGLVAEARGDVEAAVEWIRAALRMEEALLGRDDVEVASTLQTLARVLRARAGPGDRREAVQACERALAIWRAARGEQDPGFASAAIRLGDAWLELDDPARAALEFERARAIFARDPVDLAGLASALAGLGHARWRLGQIADAEVVLAESLALAREAGVDEVALADTRFVTAQTLWALGRREASRDLALHARRASARPDATSLRAALVIDAWLREHP